ncbi:tripartite tricarboxylate transporter substrate binding protein [Limnohabitans sp. Rim8]|uniref:Bug family tripartite tricarboxylate transporter substrate binding protein n=1 Tax=Limnohabitans sp. Rim8 TaxID=1100718 RepID=UPI0025E96EF3|nr:tripartite tricarboxylate transporter substrate binding protein [Limnohabitans sp. Rim8]
MLQSMGRYWGALVLTVFGGATALADTYPSKPITLVVTQGAGSGSDVTARLLAGYMGPLLGQNVVVENRVGASGIIGHQSVVRAAPDGYTLLFTSTAGLFVVPVMNANAKYSLSDFVPVAPVMRAPFAVLVANTPAAPKTMNELIQTVRAKPQSFASAGIGTMTHLGSELVLRKAGVQATHVPYKGSGAALTDLMGGQVLFATDSLTASMPLIRSGKLRALATTDLAREGSLPDVPTLSEAGIPGVQVAAIGGLFAPKGTPKEVVDKIATATAKVLANPDVAQRFAAVETDPLKVSMSAFNDLLRKEADTWSPLVRQLDLKQE